MLYVLYTITLKIQNNPIKNTKIKVREKKLTFIQIWISIEGLNIAANNRSILLLLIIYLHEICTTDHNLGPDRQAEDYPTHQGKKIIAWLILLEKKL